LGKEEVGRMKDERKLNSRNAAARVFLGRKTRARAVQKAAA